MAGKGLVTILVPETETRGGVEYIVGLCGQCKSNYVETRHPRTVPLTFQVDCTACGWTNTYESVTPRPAAK